MKMMMSRNFSIVPAPGCCFADGHLILSYIILNYLLGMQTVCADPHLTDVLVMVCGVCVCVCVSSVLLTSEFIGIFV